MYCQAWQIVYRKANTECQSLWASHLLEGPESRLQFAPGCPLRLGSWLLLELCRVQSSSASNFSSAPGSHCPADTSPGEEPQSRSPPAALFRRPQLSLTHPWWLRPASQTRKGKTSCSVRIETRRKPISSFFFKQLELLQLRKGSETSSQWFYFGLLPGKLASRMWRKDNWRNSSNKREWHTIPFLWRRRTVVLPVVLLEKWLSHIMISSKENAICQD